MKTSSHPQRIAYDELLQGQGLRCLDESTQFPNALFHRLVGELGGDLFSRPWASRNSIEWGMKVANNSIELTQLVVHL